MTRASEWDRLPDCFKDALALAGHSMMQGGLTGHPCLRCGNVAAELGEPWPFIFETGQHVNPDANIFIVRCIGTANCKGCGWPHRFYLYLGLSRKDGAIYLPKEGPAADHTFWMTGRWPEASEIEWLPARSRLWAEEDAAVIVPA